MNRLIIFDFFGVLGGELSPIFFKNHFEHDEALILKEKYFVPADMGEYTIEETLSRIAKDYNFNYDDIVNEFKACVKPNYELFSYILKLRKNNTIALLSNAAKNIFENFYPVDFNKYFDKYFISYEYGMQKPDHKFYQLCVNSFNTEFDEIYMIDDNIKNLNTLDQIGIKAIQFKNNEELFKILNKFMEE